MKFITIPKNGSSWQKPLCYSFSTESTTARDVVVEVVDRLSGDVIGKRRLYNVIEAEIDIAPYVRNAISYLPNLGVRLSISSLAKCIAVRIDGITSETRVFYYAEFDDSSSHLLTSEPLSTTILQGDIIALTVFAPHEVKVRVVDKRNVSGVATISAIQSNGMPVNVAIPTASYGRGQVPITVEIYCDTALLRSIDYTLVSTESTDSHRVVWYNDNGGIESYNFAAAVREQYEVKVVDAVDGCLPRVTAAKERCRMVSFYEIGEQMERIIRMIFSPVVYGCKETVCEPLRFVGRRVDFDDHGALRRLIVNVEKSLV